MRNDNSRRLRELREAIEDNKPLNRKQVILRLAAFVIFLGIAIACITVAVRNLGGNYEEGLQDITALQDADLPRYQLGVSFRHYFSGSSNAIKMGVNELNDVYALALKDAFRLLDPAETYESYPNLATVNRSLGQTLTVAPELYAFLKQADAYTREGKGYSLFTGALRAEWEDLRYLLEPAAFDPVNDPDEAERLARLAAATADLSRFHLEFLDDAACTLRFSVDQSYLELLAELELEDVGILDFAGLYDAFKLEYVAGRLEARGYDRGFLSSESGLTLALSGYEDGGSYCVYTQLEGAAVPAAVCPVTAGSVAVQLRAFGFADELGYYALETPGGTLLRHPWLPADGRFRETVLSAFVASDRLTASEAAYACLQLFACDTEAEALAAARALPAVGLLLRAEPAAVYTDDPAFAAYPDSGCTVTALP